MKLSFEKHTKKMLDEEDKYLEELGKNEGKRLIDATWSHKRSGDDDENQAGNVVSSNDFRFSESVRLVKMFSEH